MSVDVLRIALGGDSLATKTANALHREFPALEDCTTPEDYAEYLFSLSAGDILDIRTVGRGCLARVEAFLANHGRTLREYPL
jgi:hypothetical protein